MKHRTVGTTTGTRTGNGARRGPRTPGRFSARLFGDRVSRNTERRRDGLPDARYDPPTYIAFPHSGDRDAVEGPSGVALGYCLRPRSPAQSRSRASKLTVPASP